MIPLKDDNATRNTPIITYAILGVCVVVFLLQISSKGFSDGTLFYSYGVIPASLLGTINLPTELEKVPPYITYTYINVYARGLDAFNWKYALSLDICGQY